MNIKLEQAIRHLSRKGLKGYIRMDETSEELKATIEVRKDALVLGEMYLHNLTIVGCTPSLEPLLEQVCSGGNA